MPDAPKKEDESADGTINMGCNESYKDGRCKGLDTENCIYASASDKGADKCSGIMKLLKVPDDSTCGDQKG